jgi:hypothetical protein
VVKKNGAAEADVASPMPAAVIIADNKFTRNFMFVFLCRMLSFKSSAGESVARFFATLEARVRILPC